MTAARSFVKVAIWVMLGVVVLSISPLIVGMLSVLLGDVIGCDFLYDTSTTALCEPQVIRDAIEYGTMLNWYALATLPIGLIAFVLFLVLLVIQLLLRR